MKGKRFAENEVCKCHGGHCPGIIRVIGIGPGHEEEMTPKAVKALNDSDIIVGYNTYIALVRNLIGDKEVVGNGMRQEVDRCQKAVDLAVEGHRVAVISSGDPGSMAWQAWCWNWCRRWRKTNALPVKSFRASPLPTPPLLHWEHLSCMTMRLSAFPTS